MSAVESSAFPISDGRDRDCSVCRVGRAPCGARPPQNRASGFSRTRLKARRGSAFSAGWVCRVWVVMTVAHARDRPDPSGRVTFDRERSLLVSRVRPTFSGAFAARAANAGIGSTATLGWLAVAFLTLAYVGALGQPGDGRVRTFGLASVALYILPEIVFLVLAPVVSADLASDWQGGVYNWVSECLFPGWGRGDVVPVGADHLLPNLTAGA